MNFLSSFELNDIYLSNATWMATPLSDNNFYESTILQVFNTIVACGQLKEMGRGYQNERGEGSKEREAQHWQLAAPVNQTDGLT